MDTGAHTTHQRIAGLDGVRGVAVALVLGFHLYPRLVPGGWLGVSLFFTLSGFLITTVILRDLDNNTFTFASFYARRVRRLVPAALLVLAVFTLSWTVFGWFDTNHRTDVFFAVLQVANWQQIWEGIPYGTALASPVVHYWSLAIEEQAYVVLPLLIVLTGAKRLRFVAIGLFSVSVAATFLAEQNQSVIYFGTHTRAAEILAGVIVAAFVHRNTWTPPRLTATVVSGAGLIYLIAASLIVHLNDTIVYTGGLVATGVISAAVIATIPHSSLATLFNWIPLVWLGTVSYGIYLIHWPVLQTLKRTDLPQWLISPTTLAATCVLAAIMHTTFETPIRHQHSRRPLVALLGLIIVVVSVGFTSPKSAPKSFTDLQNQTRGITSPPITAPSQNNQSHSALPVYYFGDSKMIAYLAGLQNFVTTASEQETQIFSVGGAFTRFGCPIGRKGNVYFKKKEHVISEGCFWPTQDTGTENSKIAVVWSGTWDVTGRKIDALSATKWQDIRSPAYQRWLANEYNALFEHLRKQHAVEFIAVVNFLGESISQYQSDYTNFLQLVTAQENVSLLDLVNYLENKNLRDFFIDGSHVSIGEPTEYSQGYDNSAADLYRKWFEPALCQAISEKNPLLLDGMNCPAIDHSPRVKN
jgi:peptidoglycan/LPS O-acetylase OafA/YrhL